MAVFKSSRIFSAMLTDVRPLAEAVAERFKADGFETQIEQTLNGCLISVSKGGMFKAVCGLKSALNIEIEKLEGGRIQAMAGVGIFGMQVVPALVMYFIAWPILLTQIWGLVQQSKLDDRAMKIIQEYLAKNGVDEEKITGRCHRCSAELTNFARFCPDCGAVTTRK